jgi:XRE family transcriptional regulator, regulator of sulfur utilization
MKITRRDLLVAVISISLTVTGLALAQNAAKPVMRSGVFNWTDLKVSPTKQGERRSVFDAPTATLERLECHVTTLNPGEAPHASHHHPEEELMFVKEGAVQSVQNGDMTNRVEAGGIIFCASNEEHGLRNIGTNRATYYVLKIYPRDLVK